MNQRKSNREVQLLKQIEQLLVQNARLKDCVLLQQKIIEKQKKQKQTIYEQYKTCFQDHSDYLQKLQRTRINSDLEEKSRKLLKCLSSKVFIQPEHISSPKLQKLSSTNDSIKSTSDSQENQLLKNGKSKKKILTIEDLKSLNTSSSSLNLFNPPTMACSSRRKSYLQRLAEQITYN